MPTSTHASMGGIASERLDWRWAMAAHSALPAASDMDEMAAAWVAAGLEAVGSRPAVCVCVTVCVCVCVYV